MENRDRNVGVSHATNGTGSEIYPPSDVEMTYKTGSVFHTLLINSLIGMITLLMRKSDFIEIGGFNEQLNSLVDYELTLRIAKKYEIELVDEVLAVAYKSENSVNRRNGDKIITQCYIMNLYREELALSGLKKQKFEMVYHEACTYQCEEFFCSCIMQLSRDQDYLSYVQEKWEKLHPSSHPEKIETVDISGISACTSCMACFNICPAGAVSQGYDDEGFLIPEIDYDKCIQCGRCKEVCPVCNETSGTGLQDDCYAVMSNHEIRKDSSSGGVFKILADEILAEGGYVCGAVWNDDWQLEHIVSDRIEDVERMMSSKYVQSNMGKTYQCIKELLKQGRKVLFTGCGCQIAGPKRYLEREYENLILADVVCHGVPSQKAFDSCLENKEEITEVSFRKFAEERYALSSVYFPAYDHEMLNECCDTFVVGSDQNWNYEYAKYYGYHNYFLLDFVDESKKKVSYATSFGNVDAAVPAQIGTKLYCEFQAISVREESDVNLCRNVYGTDAVRVLDLVFLLGKKDYDLLLCGTPVLEKEPYIAVYFLDPTEEKRKLCLQVQRELGGIRLVNIMDANLREMNYYLKILEYDNIKMDLKVEEWLSYLRNAAFVITDSYHGTCFSMIFEKKFVTVKNRESDRFATFALFPEIQSRILENNVPYDVMELMEDIDYSAMNNKLAVEIEKSKQFIRESIL